METLISTILIIIFLIIIYKIISYDIKSKANEIEHILKYEMMNLKKDLNESLYSIKADNDKEFEKINHALDRHDNVLEKVNSKILDEEFEKKHSKKTKIIREGVAQGKTQEKILEEVNKID